ncbi:MAG: glycosyltransferase family 4 protein [Candidatus Thiodiazotropha taylori]
MIKVLHIINGEYYSGAERVQDLLSLNLERYGYEVLFACLKLDKFIDYCKTDKSKVFDFTMKNKYDFFRVKEISQFVTRRNIQIIHTHTPRSSVIGYPVSVLQKLPLVHHVHSPTIRDTEKIITNIINTKVENYVIDKATKVITVSNSLVNYLSSYKKDMSNVSVIHNGVPSAPNNTYSISKNKKLNIGSVALFRERKGLEILLSALKIIKSRGYEFLFHALGSFVSEEYKIKIKAVIQELGLEHNVVLHGFVKDIYIQLKDLDIFVLPSLYGEGLPMVVLEAMATGVPVVASNVEGVVEAIPDSTYGLLVEPNNAELLAESIIELLENSSMRNAISVAAYNRQISELSDSSMAYSVAELYKDLH